MIVLDASVVVELLTNGSLADSIRNDLARRDEPCLAPHLLDVEVLSALRGLLAGQRIDSHRTGQLLAELAALPVERYSHTPLIAVFGNSGTISPLTMPPTSPWRKLPIPSSTHAMKNCVKATGPKSPCSVRPALSTW